MCDHIGKKVRGACMPCWRLLVELPPACPPLLLCGRRHAPPEPHPRLLLLSQLLQVAYVKAHVNGKHEFDQYGAVGH